MTDRDEDDIPLSELLKPLSAKTMPKRKAFSIGGRELSPARARDSARRSGHSTRKARKGKKGEKE